MLILLFSIKEIKKKKKKITVDSLELAAIKCHSGPFATQTQSKLLWFGTVSGNKCPLQAAVVHGDWWRFMARVGIPI